MSENHITRIFVYTHNSIGLGHVFRTLAVITGIRKWRPDIDFLVLSGTSVPQFFHAKRHRNRQTAGHPESETLKWFTRKLEQSYPKGRTDLEFVGKKSNERFACSSFNMIDLDIFSNLSDRYECIRP